MLPWQRENLTELDKAARWPATIPWPASPAIEKVSENYLKYVDLCRRTVRGGNFRESSRRMAKMRRAQRDLLKMWIIERGRLA